MNKKGNILIILAIIVALLGGVWLYLKTNNADFIQFERNNTSEGQAAPAKVKENDQLKSYTSQALKISFSYPEDWYVDEKDFDIMITSYKTRIGENSEPSNNEIKIFIDNFNGCHSTIEENLIDPACGEGGTNVKKNEIISKEVRETAGGNFYKYIVKTPNNVFTYYLLEGKKNTLQIEKHPDPSQFEFEFNQIIDSIRFLP